MGHYSEINTVTAKDPIHKDEREDGRSSGLMWNNLRE